MGDVLISYDMMMSSHSRTSLDSSEGASSIEHNTNDNLTFSLLDKEDQVGSSTSTSTSTSGGGETTKSSIFKNGLLTKDDLIFNRARKSSTTSTKSTPGTSTMNNTTTTSGPSSPSPSYSSSYSSYSSSSRYQDLPHTDASYSSSVPNSRFPQHPPSSASSNFTRRFSDSKPFGRKKRSHSTGSHGSQGGAAFLNQIGGERVKEEDIDKKVDGHGKMKVALSGDIGDLLRLGEEEEVEEGQVERSEVKHKQDHGRRKESINKEEHSLVRSDGLGSIPNEEDEDQHELNETLSRKLKDDEFKQQQQQQQQQQQNQQGILVSFSRLQNRDIDEIITDSKVISTSSGNGNGSGSGSNSPSPTGVSKELSEKKNKSPQKNHMGSWFNRGHNKSSSSSSTESHDGHHQDHKKSKNLALSFKRSLGIKEKVDHHEMENENEIDYENSFTKSRAKRSETFPNANFPGFREIYEAI